MSDLISSRQNVSGSLVVKDMEDLSRLSTMLAKSNFFSDAKDAAQCGVKVLAGLELGIPAFAAMTGIHIIKGKPSLSANVMAAIVKRSGKYNYKVFTLTKQLCQIEFLEKDVSGWQPIGTSEMSLADAKHANLDKEWDKDSGTWKEKYNWKTYPQNMLFARAMSNGVRWFCPDIFLGAPVYTPEELGADVNDQGEVIDIPVTQSPTVQPVIRRNQQVEIEHPLNSQDLLDTSDIIAKTNLELKRLAWTNQQGRDYLVQAYGKRSRQLLTDDELVDFLKRLQAMEIEQEIEEPQDIAVDPQLEQEEWERDSVEAQGRTAYSEILD